MSDLKKLLSLQKAKTQVESTATATAPKPVGLGLKKLTGFKPAAAPAPAPKPIVLDEDDFSLESLAAMDASVIDVAPPVSSGFEDEIEATAPDRDLPPELTAQQINFVEQLDGVYPLLADPELFAQSIRIIMIELQENPEYIKLVADQDVHVMIQGMRRSMGLARIKKQEKSRKTSTGAKKTSTKKSVSADDLALLDSIMGSDDD